MPVDTIQLRSYVFYLRKHISVKSTFSIVKTARIAALLLDQSREIFNINNCSSVILSV